MRRLVVIGLLGIAVGLGLIISGAYAATEAQKRQAIDDGLAWLAANQQANGHWNDGDEYYDTAATAAAVLAFVEDRDKRIAQGQNPGDPGVPDYSVQINKGIEYLLSKATVYSISNEPTGNPDVDGNGVGVKFVTGGNNNRDTYVSGLAVPAIVAASKSTPNALVTTGPLVGRTDGSGAGGAWTYADVAQNAVDYFAYGQADPGNNARGGWRYYADYGQSDNSTAQWPVIAMMYTDSMGATTPQFVRDELRYWVDYIQNTSGTPGTGNYGSSGYDSPTNMNNESKTGGLLLEMLFAGSDLSNVPYDLSHPDLLAALDYLNRNWQDAASGYNGNFGHPYAMWAIYKGLEATIGLDDTTYITNLHTFDPNNMELDPGDVWNWWEDYCEWLVDHQTGSGGWNGFSSWTPFMTTAWNINILNAVEIPDNYDIPEPTSILVWSIFAVLGITVGWRRVRR
ncbi:MAG: hypothetical protein JW818_01350 [Pirellulales bacterium]|nr:hypothetical protein [Pirellulales bacterium]